MIMDFQNRFDKWGTLWEWPSSGGAHRMLSFWKWWKTDKYTRGCCIFIFLVIQSGREEKMISVMCLMSHTTLMSSVSDSWWPCTYLLMSTDEGWLTIIDLEEPNLSYLRVCLYIDPNMIHFARSPNCVEWSVQRSPRSWSKPILERISN